MKIERAAVFFLSSPKWPGAAAHSQLKFIGSFFFRWKVLGRWWPAVIGNLLTWYRVSIAGSSEKKAVFGPKLTTQNFSGKQAIKLDLKFKTNFKEGTLSTSQSLKATASRTKSVVEKCVLSSWESPHQRSVDWTIVCSDRESFDERPDDCHFEHSFSIVTRLVSIVYIVFASAARNRRQPYVFSKVFVLEIKNRLLVLCSAPTCDSPKTSSCGRHNKIPHGSQSVKLQITRALRDLLPFTPKTAAAAENPQN